MKGFEKNGVTMFETGLPGRCPYCNGDCVKGEEMVHGTRYSVFFECLDCGKSDHFDGFIDPNDPNWHKNKKQTD